MVHIHLSEKENAFFYFCRWKEFLSVCSFQLVGCSMFFRIGSPHRKLFCYLKKFWHINTFISLFLSRLKKELKINMHNSNNQNQYNSKKFQVSSWIDNCFWLDYDWNYWNSMHIIKKIVYLAKCLKTNNL